MKHRSNKRETLPLDSGLYNLILLLKKPRNIRIGQLGEFFFPEGFYVYTGGAKRGLKRRIARHRKRHKPKRWHIDYLRPHCSLVKIKIYLVPRKLECELNNRILNLEGAQVSVPKFGSSDCQCESHLIWFSKEKYKQIEEKLLGITLGLPQRAVFVIPGDRTELIGSLLSQRQ